MSLPLKRKRDSLPEPPGAVAGAPSNFAGGEHVVRGRGSGRGRGRGCDRGRGRSFHIPKHASQTVILKELWKHRTHSTFIPSLQFDLVTPPPPTSDTNVNLETCARPSAITDTPQLGPNHPHEQSGSLDFLDCENSPPIRREKVRLLKPPPKQTHQKKRQNQVSTWTDQTIPLLLEPFMDLLHRMKGSRESVSPPAANDSACTCTSIVLKITCVSWDR